MFRILITLIFISAWSLTLAQEVIRVKGSAQVLLEDHLSKDEAREEAIQQAKINAIENEFGTYVEQDSDVKIDNGEADFRIIGHTRVKGDWLKTTRKKIKEEKRPVRGVFRNQAEIWISCDIEGLVREIRYPETTPDIQPLNCREPECRTYDFKDGESMYLSFMSPRDGYLSVYVVQEDQFAYRLLPYQEMPEEYLQSVPVKADREYLFFANDNDFDYFPGFSYMMIDELEMATESNSENLDLYVVFSPNHYEKPVLREKTASVSNVILPRSLTREQFEDWLLENRIYDPLFQYKRITLTVIK
jgi:hypothetical protein